MSDPTPTGFHRGAIALLDVLGFKGIWRGNVAPQAILARMRRIEGTTVSAAAYWNAVTPRRADSESPTIVARNIVVSDSIFVAAWANFPEPVEHEGLACLFAVEQACRSIIIAGLGEDSLPLSYRGVITLGEFAADVDRSFVVGPAVDEVASLEREAEGPFVWLTPRAAKAFEPLAATNPGVVRYPVPMKGGRVLTTRVLNPLWAEPPLNEQLLRNLFQPLPARTPLDVYMKRQNLAAFCRHVEPELCGRLDSVIEAGLA